MNDNMKLASRMPIKRAICEIKDICSMGSLSKISLAISLSVLLSSCASTSDTMTGLEVTNELPSPGEKYQLQTSYLDNQGKDQQTEVALSGEDANLPQSTAELMARNQSELTSSGKAEQIQGIKPLPRQKVNVNNKTLSADLDTEARLAVTVNDMTMKSFLGYVFGELLAIDYVIGQDVPDDKITLNVSNKVSPQKLFDMTQQVLAQQGIGIRFADGIYYVYKVVKGQKSTVVMGFGRDTLSVPKSAGDVLQIVPLKFGVRGNIRSTLGSLVEAQISVDFEQGVLFIRGEREQVVRALELIQLLDVPANRGRFISLVSPTFVSANELVESLTSLLKTEGVDVADQGRHNGSVLFVPLPQLGAVTVFASEKELLSRVEYWVTQLDKPSQGTERQYHIYTPRFARASDLGASITPLINGVSSAGIQQNTRAKEDKVSSEVVRNPVKPTASVSSNDKMTMVVDTRSNSLIFHSSGREYQSILPLVKRMDILPEQVLLNVTIAEVQLTGEFKRGFEFALSSGNFSASNKGSIGLKDITGLNFNWTSGANEVLSKFIDGNSQINILSKPSLLVRDGAEANINVGDKIPVSGGSTSSGSGDVVTENITYTETGIQLTVTPTVNAQGVVIMEISQDITNQQTGQVGKGGNPIFFERKLKTEVVADSGQTILLGGLISENSSNSNQGVPWVKSIPLLGGLFETESKTSSKTELVILVTPKIVERSSQWNSILSSFQRALDNIELQQ